MKTKFLVVGESGSGKDSIVREVCKKMNKKPVNSYTNRPKRANETDNVEHIFLDDKTFKKLKKERKKDIIAYTKIFEPKNILDRILSKFSIYIYGNRGYEYLALTDNLEDGDLYIIDPKGIKYMNEKHPEIDDYVILYIYADYDTRLERVIKNRGENEVCKFNKRAANESKQFIEFKTGVYADKHRCYIIHNNHTPLSDAVNQICSIIDAYE